MKHLTSPCFTFVFLLCTALSAALLPATAAAQSEDEYQAQLQKLAATIKQLQQELGKVKSAKNELNESLQASEEEAAELTKKIAAIREALAREKKQLSQHQAKRAELEDKKLDQQNAIEEVVRQAHALGQQSRIKLLLNQEELGRISRLLQYHDYIVSAQLETLQAYRQTLDDIAATEAEMLASSQLLEQQQDKLDQRFAALKQSQSKRLQTLKALNAKINQKGGSIKQYRQDREQLEKLFAEARRALDKLVLPERDATPFRKARGKLLQPVKGRVAHRFGTARNGGTLRWDGMFVTGKMGSSVSAVHHGRVVFADYMRGHGLLLIVDHGDGYMSLYAHNQSLLKATGDWVSTGESIATLGNTGGQNRAGLYFEIRHNGKTLNPHRWLSRG